MSGEISRSPLDARLARDVAEKIRPDWGEFESLAADPAVQEFCAFESRYLFTPREDDFAPDVSAEGTQRVIERYLQFDPLAEQFTADEAATALERMNHRLDNFMRGMIQTYCDRKRIPVPAAEDTEQVGEIIGKILVGGIEKVYDYMDRSAWQEDETLHIYGYDSRAYLPATLLMLTARMHTANFYDEVGEGQLEPVVSQGEIDEAIDAKLQELCHAIRANKKLFVPKQPADERILAATANCLRTLYHQGQERGFKQGLMAMFSPVFKPNTDRYLTPGATDHWDIEAIIHDAYTAFADHFNRVVGSDFEYPGHQLAFKQLSAAEQGYDRMDTDPQGFDRRLADMMYRLNNAHSARHFVDAIADGRIKYSQVVQAMMQLRKQPLSNYELPEIDVNKLWVDWEMLPRGLIEPGELGQPPDEMVNPKDPRERQLDWRRISRLLSYAVTWGPEASFARTNFPNLPDDKQYYAVILPQQLPDGTILEHAIADHPEQGNGLYMWRAERGALREEGDHNRNLTWREVLAHERAIARQLGARRFYHTKNLEVNVLDYLTAPPESLLQHRYAVGRGAVRMARLARKLT